MNPSSPIVGALLAIPIAVLIGFFSHAVAAGPGGFVPFTFWLLYPHNRVEVIGWAVAGAAFGAALQWALTKRST